MPSGFCYGWDCFRREALMINETAPGMTTIRTSSTCQHFPWCKLKTRKFTSWNQRVWVDV